MARPVTQSNDQSWSSSGWPLGLQIMNLRLRVMEISGNQTTTNRRHLPASSSFSSFSSSNLDTESTASFFQDNSVSLGRLIGFRPAVARRNGATAAAAGNGCEERSGGDGRNGNVSAAAPEGQGGICIPLILGTIERMSRRTSKERERGRNELISGE